MWFLHKNQYSEKLSQGQIGFITAGIKHVSDCKVGDTITDEKLPVKMLLKV